MIENLVQILGTNLNIEQNYVIRMHNQTAKQVILHNLIS